MNAAPAATSGFRPFGAAHLGALAAIAGAIGLGVLVARSASPAAAAVAARWLGVVLIGWYFGDIALRIYVLGDPPVQVLPFHFCGWVHMIAAFALISGWPAAVEVQILLTLAGVLQSLITPTPGGGAPRLELPRYFAYHGLLVGSGVWALLALHPSFTWLSTVRALATLQVFELITGLIDWRTGQNFMYLRSPPPSPTLFDLLGPWPWYLLSLEVVSVVLLSAMSCLCRLIVTALPA